VGAVGAGEVDPDLLPAVGQELRHRDERLRQRRVLRRAKKGVEEPMRGAGRPQTCDPRGNRRIDSSRGWAMSQVGGGATSRTPHL